MKNCSHCAISTTIDQLAAKLIAGAVIVNCFIVHSAIASKDLGWHASSAASRQQLENTPAHILKCTSFINEENANYSRCSDI